MVTLYLRISGELMDDSGTYTNYGLATELAKGNCSLLALFNVFFGG